MSAPRLDTKTKARIVAAYLLGEKVTDIGRRFGVHFTYPALLAKRYGYSGRMAERAKARQKASRAATA